MCPFDEGAWYRGSNTVNSRLVGFFFGVWEIVLSECEDGRFGSVIESAYSIK